MHLVLRLRGGWAVNEGVEDKWSEYVRMLKNCNWKNIPNSFEEVSRMGNAPLPNILNAIDDYTNSHPSRIRNQTDLIRALKEINVYYSCRTYIEQNLANEIPASSETFCIIL